MRSLVKAVYTFMWEWCATSYGLLLLYSSNKIFWWEAFDVRLPKSGGNGKSKRKTDDDERERERYGSASMKWKFEIATKEGGMEGGEEQSPSRTSGERNVGETQR